MKKKLKSDLVSLAHQILKMDSDSDYNSLKLQAQKVYEALSVLAYVEAQYNSEQVAEDTAVSIKAVEEEDSQVVEESVQEVQENQPEAPAAVPKTEAEESDLERIARIAAANDVIFERLRKPQETQPESPQMEEPVEKPINQASLHEPVMEKIKDIVAQMPPEADAIEDMFQQITNMPKPIKNDKYDIGEYGQLAQFEETEKSKEEKPRTLNERSSRGLSFGLNDRIAFIKHLFNGSTADYNRVLSQLNTANSKSEAFSLIDQMVKPDYNYWEGKEVYETRFKELVARKFD